MIVNVQSRNPSSSHLIQDCPASSGCFQIPTLMSRTRTMEVGQLLEQLFLSLIHFLSHHIYRHCILGSGDKYINGEIIPCKYPTYQPKQRSSSKYESRKYERRRDGPPAERRRSQQPESAS